MYPIINVFGLRIQSYSLIAAVGFIVTAVVAIRLSSLRKIPSHKSLTAALVSAFGIFIGGHLLFVLTNIGSIVNTVSKPDFRFSDLLPFVSGMVFYGGFFGALAAMFVFSSVNKDVSRADVFDVFAVSVPLFHVFGRIGCFFAGCCYGVECNFGIATYLNTSPVHYGIRRFPVALTEAFVNLLIFMVLLYFFKRNKYYGKLVFAYLLMYAPARFVLEFFRGDEIRGFVFGLSTSQFISLLTLAFLLIYIVARIAKKSSKSD